MRFFERYTFDHANVRTVDDPEFGFFAAARAGRLPNVSFIDPRFVELPPGGNCDGPPADVALGQDLVRRVVEAVISGPAWDKTMLVILYDEHGGFYDHVPPPTAARVSDELPITTHGVRVPATVVSPWVGQGTVFGHDAGTTGNPGALVFDHTSILKTIARRFLSAAPPFMGARYAAASDLSSVMLPERRTPQFRPFIPYNMQFTKSSLVLELPSGNPGPGTGLVQSVKNGTAEQDFAFEDAGNGFVHLRSRASGLYLTVREPSTASAAPTVVQDIKFPATPGQPPGQRPELQRWKVISVATNVQQAANHVIANQAHPDKRVQPADAAAPGSAIILGAPGGGPFGGGKVWSITSPLLPPGGVVVDGGF